jgi:hypothetical protein
MMLGIGDTTTGTPAATTTPGFSDGLSVWKSPSAGFTALQTLATSPSTAFASGNLPVSLGVLIVPVALVVALMSFSGGGRR